MSVPASADLAFDVACVILTEGKKRYRLPKLLDAMTAASRVIGSTDTSGKASLGPAVWVGDIDELWRLPKPTGRGGPWHETAVEPGTPSDPYLMGG